LVVTNKFYGAERVAYNLSRGLQNMGVNVIVVTSQALREKFSEIRPSAIYVLPNHEGNVIRRGRAILREVSCLRQIISKERPDIIHVHGGLPRLLMLATDRNQIVVETLHGVGLTKGEAFPRLTHKVADLLAAMSFDGSVFYMRKAIGDYSRLRLLRPSAVIYNAVDEDFTRLVSQGSESPIDGEYIAWCGRLDAIKGADLLLRAFARIGRRDVRLVFLGDGPQRNYLETLAKSLCIDGQTVFRGYVDGLEKATFFRHASAICVNLTNPGLSQSLLEGVFSGNPTIACYDSEVEQIFGESVSLIEEPSPTKLAAILEDTLDGRQRLDRQVSLDTSLEKRFSLEYFTEQYLAFYSRIKSGSSH
jgi:glycosyltransferase involved in cell wall biosynthesis